jgi:hypothetical protein
MNQRTGRAMRFCDSCEVAMGLMTLNEYTDRFIHHAGLCPYCGKPAINEDKEELWMTVVSAYDKYGMSMYRLRKLIAAGEIRSRPGGHYGGRQVREKDLLGIMEV